MQTDHWLVLGTVIVLAGVIVAEHLTIGRFWERREYTRRALGILTVFLFGLALALLGVLDLDTVLILFGLFGVAACALVATRETEKELTNRRIVARVGRGNSDGPTGELRPGADR
jgi:hypothetical protein